MKIFENRIVPQLAEDQWKIFDYEKTINLIATEVGTTAKRVEEICQVFVKAGKIKIERTLVLSEQVREELRRKKQEQINKELKETGLEKDGK